MITWNLGMLSTSDLSLSTDQLKILLLSFNFFHPFIRMERLAQPLSWVRSSILPTWSNFRGGGVGGRVMWAHSLPRQKLVIVPMETHLVFRVPSQHHFFFFFFKKVIWFVSCLLSFFFLCCFLDNSTSHNTSKQNQPKPLIGLELW